jgi:hypothetical protein
LPEVSTDSLNYSRFLESLTRDYFDLGAAREIVHEYSRIFGATSGMAIANETRQAGNAAPPLCWICNENTADSGEHKTKRSDLLAVLGRPTQDAPFYYHDLEQPNRAVKSLDAKILKAPVRICANCNNARTQPHDLAWEFMSDRLRNRHLKIGRWVRANKIFPCYTRRQMTNVHLYFIKLFGCMVSEAKANGHDVPIDIAPFSKAIMTGRPHPEVHLQFGRCDGAIGRSNLHCWTSDHGSVFGGWLYELDTIAISVLYAQAGRWEHRADLWHPDSKTSAKRFLITDFMYSRLAAREAVQSKAKQA